jgi:2-desacetyl-2-hydroxyethyl bacteriochlorophyllide A dehydrogenase
MTATARAAVLVEPERLELREYPLPEIGRDDALVRIEACGICGTDYEQFRGQTPTPVPVVPGHEPLGIVAEIGDRAAERMGVQAGDRVAVRSRYGCGSCEACLRVDHRRCADGGNYGFTLVDRAPSLWGGYADYLYVAPASVLWKVRSDIPALTAVLFNPLGAGFDWAVNVPGLEPGDDVVVFGAGQRGLACVIAARAAGAGRILVTGLARDRYKLDLALELGADVAVDVERDDPVEAALELTGGRGARVVVDTTPYATEPLVQAVRVTAKEGTIVIAGLKAGRTVDGLQPDEISLRELTVRGVRGVKQEAFVRAIELIEAGTVPLDRLNTHAFDVAEAERAVRTLAGDFPEEQPIHVAIVPSNRE